MTPEQFREARRLFEAALGLPEARRAAWLEEACPGDAEVRTLAARLLGDRHGPMTRLERELEETTAGLAGTTLGPYRFVERLGEGGMGTVYLAVRDEEFRREVAIKVLKRGADSGEVVRRFENERQILASLEHPNIARLYDGGRTPDGLPYFVMEYVPGEPIDAYCRRLRLSVEQCLRLFLEVCGAVQAAHQRLVVHRDLKPGNILVTADGTPKLLDFGIAKLLDTGMADQPQWTRLVPLTPCYASPEQLRGELVTTASDVYSLGVLLFELFAGEPPFERPASSSVLRLAELAAADAPQLSAFVRHRGGPGAARLARRLEGDIDTIVAMALRIEPARRYASAAALAEDIERHLEGKPVRARPDTLPYRLRKFAGRHRVGLAAAAAAIAALLTGFVTTTWQWQTAQAERARAEHRFNDLRGLASSVVFELHDAIAELPGSTPARRLLVDRALAYLDSLAAEAGTDPALLGELAAAYQRLAEVQGVPSWPGLGDTAGARRSIERALELRHLLHERAPGDRQHELAIVRLEQHLGLVEEYTGDKDTAFAHFDAAVGRAERLAGENPDDVAVRRELVNALVGRSDVSFELGREAEGSNDLEAARAVAAGLAAARPDDLQSLHGRSKVESRLAYFHYLRGDWPAMLESARLSLELDRQLAAARPLSTTAQRDLAVSHEYTGYAYENLGDLAAAERELESSLAIRERLLALDPTNTLAIGDAASVSRLLARVRGKSGNAPAALDLLRHSIELEERVPAPDVYRRMEHAETLTELANVLEQVGRPDGVADALRRAIALREAVARDDPLLAGNAEELARLIDRLAGYTSAETMPE